VSNERHEQFIVRWVAALNVKNSGGAAAWGVYRILEPSQPNRDLTCVLDWLVHQSLELGGSRQDFSSTLKRQLSCFYLRIFQILSFATQYGAHLHSPSWLQQYSASILALFA
jgi:hypothetical protein